MPSTDTTNWIATRSGVFVIELIYLIALWTLALLYFVHVIHPRHSIGNMPVAVIWYGALGGVLISLVGVFEHPFDWNAGYVQWHWARPVVGASLAVVSVLILQAGIISVGADPHKPGSSSALYFVVGFVVGYREETFRELIKRFADVLLRPGTSGDVGRPAIASVTPSSGPAAGGTSVTIDGSGFVRVRQVMFGDAAAIGVSVDSHTRIRATTPPSVTGVTSVTIKTKSGSASADYTYI